MQFFLQRKVSKLVDKYAQIIRLLTNDLVHWTLMYAAALAQSISILPHGSKLWHSPCIDASFDTSMRQMGRKFDDEGASQHGASIKGGPNGVRPAITTGRRNCVWSFLSFYVLKQNKQLALFFSLGISDKSVSKLHDRSCFLLGFFLTFMMMKKLGEQAGKEK